MKKVILITICLLTTTMNIFAADKLPNNFIINTPGLLIIDNTVRKFADYIKDEKTVTIKPISGASGDLSIANAVKENNIAFVMDASFNINRVINPNPGFDRDNDMILIPPVFAPTFLLVTSKLKNIPDLKTLKTKIINNEKINIGMTGTFPLYYNAVLNKSLNIEYKPKESVFIYYRTYPELATALIRGDVDYSFVVASPIFINNQDIIILAAAGSIPFPGIPLLSDTIPDMGVQPFAMFAVPKNKTENITEITKLINKFVNDPVNIKFVKDQGFDIMYREYTVKMLNDKIKKELSDKLLNYGVNYNY